MTRRTWAVLLRHRGHGPLHGDLVVAYGRRCPTLHITPQGVRWGQPHRRRYLTYAGPVGGGRGVVDRCWRGRVVWTASRLDCDGWGIGLRGRAVVPLALRRMLRRP